MFYLLFFLIFLNTNKKSFVEISFIFFFIVLQVSWYMFCIFYHFLFISEIYTNNDRGALLLLFIYYYHVYYP
jgi:hypothetical protein